MFIHRENNAEKIVRADIKQVAQLERWKIEGDIFLTSYMNIDDGDKLMVDIWLFLFYIYLLVDNWDLLIVDDEDKLEVVDGWDQLMVNSREQLNV